MSLLHPRRSEPGGAKAIYQVATGALSPGEVASPLRAIFKRHPNVRVLLAEVAAFDLERQKPGLGSGLPDRFARHTAAHRLVSPRCPVEAPRQAGREAAADSRWGRAAAAIRLSRKMANSRGLTGAMPISQTTWPASMTSEGFVSASHLT
jgi:hypothetical protein